MWWMHFLLLPLNPWKYPRCTLQKGLKLNARRTRREYLACLHCKRKKTPPLTLLFPCRNQNLKSPDPTCCANLITEEEHKSNAYEQRLEIFPGKKKTRTRTKIQKTLRTPPSPISTNIRIIPSLPSPMTHIIYFVPTFFMRGWVSRKQP